ncbi:MAG: TlpA disulfide reductase family protein [Acidimicrobiia bacterium]|jgi:thiol-disulfide isomerase/thioredoxin
MDTDSTSTESEATAPVERGQETIDVNAQEATKQSAGASRGLLIAIAIGIAAVLALQVFVLISTSQTDQQIAALDEQVDDVAFDVSEVRRSVVDVDRKVDELSATVPVAPAASGASAAAVPNVPAGTLPPFEQGQPDAALGVVLGEVAGPEYYSGSDLTIDPSDGTIRAWMVWAHWCPYCQQELPALTEWYDANAENYPNVELLTVTTSIDEARGNPLEPYLDDLQLSFPAIVDADLSLAEQFGASAFPFWVFTAPDGTTLLRIAGFLEIEQVAEIFDQLNTLSA